MTYADDTQIILNVSGDSDTARLHFNTCFKDVVSWMRTNCLLLNTDKIGVSLWEARTMWSQNWWQTLLGKCPDPGKEVRVLGFICDNNFDYISQIPKLSTFCFLPLQVLRKILPFLPGEQTFTVIEALMVFHLDYGNTLYFALPKGTSKKLYIIHILEIQSDAKNIRSMLVSHHLV